MSVDSIQQTSLAAKSGNEHASLTITADEESPFSSSSINPRAFTSWLESMPSMLPWIFLLLATPTVIFLSVCTPAFQSPDEWTHFARAYQVSRGGFYGGEGGFIDQGMEEVDAHYEQLEHDGKVKLTAADDAAGHSIKWGGRKIYSTFPNTSSYPPIGYLPQALGIIVGRMTGRSIAGTLTVARLLNGAFALFISALSLYWCRRGKLALFALLLMPMTTSLFSSCSQDASLISFTCLAFALVSHQIAAGSPLSWSRTILVSTALLFVLLARPPYAPLLFALFLPGLLPRWGKWPAWSTGLRLTCLMLALTAIWWVAASPSRRMALNPNSGETVDARMQVLNVMHHPGVVPAVARDLAHHSFTYASEIVGYLGWLDAPLPRHYYIIMGFGLLVALVGELAHRGKSNMIATAFVLSSALLAAIAVVVIEYLAWTPVGSTVEAGLQGRYFIPLLVAACAGLPHLIRSDRTYRGATAIVVLCQLVTAFYLPWGIIQRYYLR